MKGCIEKAILVVSSYVLLFFVLKRKNLLVLDLDNTLVKTREFQLAEGTLDVYGSSRFPNVTVKAKNYIGSVERSSVDILVLSARPYKYWWRSMKYCSEQISVSRTILTRTAENKLYFLKRLNALDKNIVYVDDLSHGLDKVELYDDVIDTVQGLEKIDYKDINWIGKNLL